MLIRPSAHAAFAFQQQRLEERKTAQPKNAVVCGTEFLVLPGVYDTSVDTELMAESVVVGPKDRFLEIGCGTGAVSLLLARRCAGGIGIDINPLAVQNAEENAIRHHISNVQFLQGDGYAGVTEKFAVLLCNPPYNNKPAHDEVERMFWDPADQLKKTFFEEARAHLLPKGRVYFGWADFADIDVMLPFRLADRCGLSLVAKNERCSHSRKHRFFVLEFA